MSSLVVLKLTPK